MKRGGFHSCNTSWFTQDAISAAVLQARAHTYTREAYSNIYRAEIVRGRAWKVEQHCELSYSAPSRSDEEKGHMTVYKLMQGTMYRVAQKQ